MANNVFGLIKANSKGLTAEKLKTLFGSSNCPILAFPPGLGGSQDSDGQLADIPYVIFAPYARPTGIDAFTSTSYTKVLDELPPPKFAIALPLPSSALKTNYGVNYDTFELGQYGIIASGLKSTYNAFTKTNEQTDVNSARSRAVAGSLEAIDKAKSIAGSSLYAGISALAEVLSPNLENAKDKFLGIKENPFTETLFKDVNPRSHEFTYSFHPRNYKESVIVDNILQLFKFYMLPAATTFAGSSLADGGFFSFPYEFQITYSVSDTTFTLLPSVLENLHISYGGDSSVPNFYVSDPTDALGRRYPARIDMTMNFKEVMFLTRDRIEASSSSVDYATEEARNKDFIRYRF